MIKLKTDNILKFTFIFSVIVFVSSVGCKFYLCNSVTVKNGEFEKTSLRKKDLEEDINRLNALNSSLSSISYIEKRSSELGFIEMEDRLISLDLDSSTQVALVN
jgi:hypothetical protein